MCNLAGQAVGRAEGFRTNRTCVDLTKHVVERTEDAVEHKQDRGRSSRAGCRTGENLDLLGYLTLICPFFLIALSIIGRFWENLRLTFNLIKTVGLFLSYKETC